MLDAPPKQVASCSVCDVLCRDVVRETPEGRKIYGPQRVGTQVAILAHVSGRWSEHTLCEGCDLTPDAFPLLWARNLLAYRPGIDRKRPVDLHVQYAHDLPIGVLHMRRIEVQGER